MEGERKMGGEWLIQTERKRKKEFACSKCQLHRLRPGWLHMDDVLSSESVEFKGGVERSSSSVQSRDHWKVQPKPPSSSPASTPNFCRGCNMTAERPGWGFLDDLRSLSSAASSASSAPPPIPTDIQNLTRRRHKSRASSSSIPHTKYREAEWTSANHPKGQTSGYALKQVRPTSSSSSSMVRGGRAGVGRQGRGRKPKRCIYGIDEPQHLDLSDSTSGESTSLGEEADVLSSLTRTTATPHNHSTITAAFPPSRAGNAQTEIRVRVKIPPPGEAPRPHLSILLPYDPHRSPKGFPPSIRLNQSNHPVPIP